MTELDSVILELVRRHKDADKMMEPLEATEELAEWLKAHGEYIPYRRYASALIEQWKKKNAFNVLTQAGFLVILEESVNRRWVERSEMDARHIRMRMKLLNKKRAEFIKAVDEELEYWRQELFGFNSK